MTVIPFPLTRPSRHRMNKLGDAVLFEVDLRLQEYTWMWPTGAPGWVGDGWHKFVCDYFSSGPSPSADWPEMWSHFVECWLAHQPEWQGVVEASLAEMEAA